TPHFQIIFPAEFEKEANRLATTLDYLYDHVSKTLNYQPRKISVLLHSESSYSNGLVTWAPKRMELYTTPAQDNYAQDWLDQLAVHELRHVVQINKLNQGITQIMSILFGQQAVGSVTGLLPRWFLEGDAVNTETALTSTGRGRSASFEMQVKAMVTERDSLFSYEKMLRGSYKDYIPDEYQFGYPMVAWVRKNYGTSVFSNDLQFIGRNPYVLFPFPLSLKKQIGLPSRKLYKASYSDLRQQWRTQISNVPQDSYITWNSINKKNFTSYRFPQFINDTTILAVKSGIDQLTEFILLYKSGKEKKVFTPGTFNNDKFSYANGKYVWGEEIPDIRWTNRSYNCIKIGDLRTNQVRLLTRKTRYFAPSLSSDGKKIAAVEVTLSNDIYLVILDSKTGSIMERIASPQNKFLQMPEWIDQNDNIVMVATDRKGKSLVSYTITANTWKILVPTTTRNITLPTHAGDYILYTSDYNGTDNIYAVNLSDTSKWQVTNAKYGITDAKISANNAIIGFTKYTSHGFDVESASFDPKSWKKLNDIHDSSPKLYEASAKQENFNFQDSILPDKQYKISRYSKLAHTINIHSWAPFYYDYNYLNVTNNSITPGFSILSQDKLSTCYASAGLSYFQGQSYWKSDITYQGLYPVVDFSVTAGGPQVIRNEPNWRPNISGTSMNTITSVYIPLNFTRSCYITGVTPLAQWEYTNDVFMNPKDSSSYEGMDYLTYGLNAYSYLQMSYRDLAPKWGLSVSSRITSTPLDNIQFRSIWYVLGRLYLPGLLNHHSLQLSLGYQEQEPSRWIYSSRLAFPRGYLSRTSYRLTAFTSDYSFPIFYPDFSLGALLYVKRIRGNLFFDIANNYRTYAIRQNQRLWETEQLSSYGFDLTSDFHVLRIIFPINAGVRMIYIPQLKQYSSQLLLSVDLSNY
ncbi:MAG TPA: hypothetical protein VIH57_08490, partial [Bacteroidales bacterium]